MKLPPKEIKKFQGTILRYYKKHRRDFPWRKTRDAYAILVSEVMLQQTQAQRVVPFFIAWMKQFPTVETLAKADVGEVLRAWQGLGYNRRALNLKRAGEMTVKEYGGKIPTDIPKIDALPGVGPYTAGAIGVFAFNLPSAFIETNIRTVYLHFFFKGRTKVSDEEILGVIEKTMPYHPSSPLLGKPARRLAGGEGRKKKQPPVQKTAPSPFSKGDSTREWYGALMDYGAMLKATVGNPNSHSKSYTRQSIFKGSRRELRGAILRFITQKGKMTLANFKKNVSDIRAEEVVFELVAEGFLKKLGKSFTLV